MTTYNVGSISVLLEEVSAIGIVHHPSMGEKFLDIYLKYGQKVVATFSATEEERKWPDGERRGYADLCSGDFVEIVKSEVKDFKSAWETVNKKYI